ncbi:glutathione S-transferase family protein [Sphingosinicella sp. LHD-64]|uniref:glutathione S-transferase family protein n=1 Tax=Sphingosinicella sp. LHD-64 TaxID=3072139 RepID=UPI00280F1E5D|nr:glutathione S-transferase family protein [Sphingosinicella sp. LHD-64]MDQ8757819.1 glutathione S-transferase family protein [Sphingosinicella sp. LHD-64]
MIIYGSSLSPFVRKVVAFAAEKGVAVENQIVRPGEDNPDFLACSPFRKIPALRDGDFLISDSSAIISYLEALRPEPNLIPTEPRARARAIWFDEFMDTILFDCGRKMFWNRIVAPLTGRQGDLVAAEKAEREELPPLFDYLESVIPDSGFLVDDRLTLADIAVASPFANFHHLGIAVNPATHPRLARYAAAMLARPSYATQLERETGFLARFLPDGPAAVAPAAA